MSTSTSTSTRTRTRTRTGCQDPRYLQLWLVFDWPTPTDRVPVECADCRWTGRRARRRAIASPCPRCAGQVAGRRPASRGRAGNVVQLAEWSRQASGRVGEPGRETRRS